MWNSGRPDLAQRDSAWLSSRPPPLFVGIGRRIYVGLPSASVSPFLSPSFSVSPSPAPSFSFSLSDARGRGGAPAKLPDQSRGGAFLCAALSIDPLPEVPSLSLSLCFPFLSLPLPATVLSPPRILPFFPRCVSFHRTPLSNPPSLPPRFTPRSLLFVRPYHRSPPPPFPPLPFFFRAFPSCVFVSPFIARSSSSPSLTPFGRPLPLSTHRPLRRACNQPPWRTTPIPCVAFSLSLVVIVALVCSSLVVVDDSRRHASIGPEV